MNRELLHTSSFSLLCVAHCIPGTVWIYFCCGCPLNFLLPAFHPVMNTLFIALLSLTQLLLHDWAQHFVLKDAFSLRRFGIMPPSSRDEIHSTVLLVLAGHEWLKSSKAKHQVRPRSKGTRCKLQPLFPRAQGIWHHVLLIICLVFRIYQLKY